MVKFMSTTCEIALRRMPQNTVDDTSTLLQVMHWYRQTTSRYLDPDLFNHMASLGRKELIYSVYMFTFVGFLHFCFHVNV